MGNNGDATMWRKRANDCSDKLQQVLIENAKYKLALQQIRQMGTLDNKWVETAHEAIS